MQYVLSYDAPELDEDQRPCVGASLISSPRELRRALDQLTAWAIWRADPMMVHLTDEDLGDGPVLSVGLGAAASCADWTAHSQSQRWTTHDTGAPPGISTHFADGATPRLMPGAAMISVGVAYQAMDAFWCLGRQPVELVWKCS